MTEKNPWSGSLSEKDRVPKKGGDIRFIILSSCQSGCTWCHLEGHKTLDDVGRLNEALAGWKKKDRRLPMIERLDGVATLEDTDNVLKIAKATGLKNVHLTGGEPTLHPQLLEIIKRLSEGGMQVGMTTNGEIALGKFHAIVRSGISSINFSIHALTPEQYLEMDINAQNIERTRGHQAALAFAQGRLKRKLENMSEAIAYSRETEGKFRVKTNSVVTDADVATGIVLWANKNGVSCRLQRNLNDKAASGEQITTLIAKFGAKPVFEYIAVGDTSGAGVDFDYPAGSIDGKPYPAGKFRIKDFGEILLEPVCASCPLQNTAKCRERGFYGLRVEHGRVLTCIDRVDDVTSMSHKDFLANRGGVMSAVKSTYESC